MEVNSDNNTEPNNSRSASSNNAVAVRNNAILSWRPSCIVNVLNDIIRRSTPVLESIPTAKNKTDTVAPLVSTAGTSSNGKLTRKDSTRSSKDKSKRNTVINIVLVEAKGLPHVPDDGLSHGIYCKFRLGSHTCKSKSAPTTRYPQWKERFKLHGNGDQMLHISLWDKGKQKNFMGSSVLDLSICDKDRTHDIWQQLDEGYGSIHLSVTKCALRNIDFNPTPEPKIEDLQSKYAFYNVSTDIKVVGQLYVRVCGARGLSGKPNAYCTIELDNERIQTPQASSSGEPIWDANYVFNIYDVTSTVDVRVYDSSINLLNNFLGRVTIPLLRIKDGEMHWHALKDYNKRRSAKGNCPRIRLEMSLFWNPVTASLKLFRPKQVKYIEKKPPKFDVALVYKNVKFIRDTFDFLFRINESFKRLFEWEDREVAATFLIIWLIFWYLFEPWMGPLLIAALFPVVTILDQDQRWELSRTYNTDDAVDSENSEDVHNGDSITNKVKGLPEMTLTITDGIEYMVSVAERLHNLATFKVPYLSYLTMVLLIGFSAIIYAVPFKYLMITFGLYKFLRKLLHPDRVLNNDLLDFISRIPDNKILKDWKELGVPEPHQAKRIGTVAKSTSSSHM